MANGPKLTFDLFKSQLNEGRYDSGTAARRAIGRVKEFSKDEKSKAQELIDKKFGVSALPAKAAKASTKKTTKVKAAVKSKGKPGRPKGFSPKKKALSEPPQTNDKASMGQFLSLDPMQVKLSNAAMTMQASTSALQVVTESKKMFATVDFVETAANLNEVIRSSAEVFQASMSKAPAYVKNGKSAEATFAESLPE